MTPRTQILWVDDHIDGFAPYVAALNDAGFEVTTAASTPAALTLARQRPFDIVLVDILMPPPDGIELLRRVRPLQPAAALGTFSSYLYLDRYRDQLRALAFPVELIDKDFAPIDAPDFDERFIVPIRELATRGVTKTISVQDLHLSMDRERDPFDLPLHEFMRMPILEKDKLVQRARKIAAPTIEKAFAEGKIWVLLCGDKKQIRTHASSPADIPSDEKIMEFARNQQRPPYQFFKAVTADDIWSDCGHGTYASDYPTLTLRGNGTQLTVHFDTGAPMTFFSYEELVRIGVMRPTTNFGLSERTSHKPYMAAALNVEMTLVCQRSGQATRVTLTGQAVREWVDGPYARYCNEKCGYELTPDQRRLCDERLALVGRNLLTENGLLLVLDGVSKKTGFADITFPDE